MHVWQVYKYIFAYLPNIEARVSIPGVSVWPTCHCIIHVCKSSTNAYKYILIILLIRDIIIITRSDKWISNSKSWLATSWKVPVSHKVSTYPLNLL